MFHDDIKYLLSSEEDSMSVEISDKLAALANFFIKKATQAGESMTPMKLIKMCYIAQGMHLSLTDGKPLFPEIIEAWQYGPVVPVVYKIFRKFGSDQITEYVRDTKTNAPTPSENLLDKEELEAANQAWDAAGTWTAFKLSEWCHREGSPWDQVVQESGAKSNTPIPFRLIKQEFDRFKKKK